MAVVFRNSILSLEELERPQPGSSWRPPWLRPPRTRPRPQPGHLGRGRSCRGHNSGYDMNLHGGQLGRALDRLGRNHGHDLGHDSGQIAVDATAATTSATLSWLRRRPGSWLPQRSARLDLGRRGRDRSQDLGRHSGQLGCDLVYRGRDLDRDRGHDLGRHSRQLGCDLDRRGHGLCHDLLGTRPRTLVPWRPLLPRLSAADLAMIVHARWPRCLAAAVAQPVQPPTWFPRPRPWPHRGRSALPGHDRGHLFGPALGLRPWPARSGALCLGPACERSPPVNTPDISPGGPEDVAPLSPTTLPQPPMSTCGLPRTRSDTATLTRRRPCLSSESRRVCHIQGATRKSQICLVDCDVSCPRAPEGWKKRSTCSNHRR